MKVPHVVREEGVGSGGSNPGSLVVVYEGSHVSCKERFQVSPDCRDVGLRNKGDGAHHGEGVADLRVWNNVLLHQVGLLEVFEEGSLVMEEAPTPSRGRPHLRHRVVDGELEIALDALWLERTKAVQLLQQVLVEERARGKCQPSGNSPWIVKS